MSRKPPTQHPQNDPQPESLGEVTVTTMLDMDNYGSPSTDKTQIPWTLYQVWRNTTKIPNNTGFINHIGPRRSIRQNQAEDPKHGSNPNSQESLQKCEMSTYFT